MQLRVKQAGLVAVLAFAGLASTVHAGVTNVVPWSESFESYPSGVSIVESNGWTAAVQGSILVTNGAGLLSALVSYTNGTGRTYPLVAGSHTNVAELTAESVNNLKSATTNGIATVDFMALPTWSDSDPASQSADQFAVYVWTNGLLTIWHSDYTASPATNGWLNLTNSPVVSTTAWVRLTFVQDYTNHMFQISVDGRPLVDGRGWSYGGASPGGSWFHMAATNNGGMSAFVAEAAPAYLDDLNTTMRSLTWSRVGFSETATNNGTIDNASPLSITLAQDTFTGIAGDDLVLNGKFLVAGLPSNLVAVALLNNSSNVLVSLTNSATASQRANSVSNLVMRFADTAFTLQRAYDVAGSVVTNGTITFADAPALVYSGLAFSESVNNDGTIDNTSPLLITLTNGAFAGSAGEDFATNSLKLQVTGAPSGLSAEVLMLSTTQLQVRLTGAASPNNVAQDTSSLHFAFQPGAFNLGVVPPASVLNASTNYSVSFLDAPTLSYGVTTFQEPIVNDGTVGGTTITLVNKQFNAAQGEDLVATHKVTVANLPSGLGLQITRDASVASATLTFTGSAGSHAAANSISNLGITFSDSAFVGGRASDMANASRNNLVIQFRDPRIVTYSGTTFNELTGGQIDNRRPVTLTLSGETYSGTIGDDFVAAGKLVANNLPSGLSAQATLVSTTQLSVQLLGTAGNNTSADNVSNVVFTLQNSAFSLLNASSVVNYQQSGIKVLFNNLTGYFNLVPFADNLESYPAGFRVDGSNGWSATYLADAGIVTNAVAANTALATYMAVPRHTSPVEGPHLQTLYVSDDVNNEVHSGSATNIYVDFMMIAAVAQDPSTDANDELACYVNTNFQVVVWHSNRTSLAAEWLVLSNAPTISTSAWTRFTFQGDYVHNMYQVRLNEGDPISSPQGWTEGGAAPTGTWFYMAQPRGSMSTFKLTGVGSVFVDDFTVRETLPDEFGGGRPGCVYIFR